jgi:pyroglutamyl-peptidase
VKTSNPIVLVTGFAPFGGERINPSWEIAKALPRSIAKQRIERMEVPTEFGRAIDVTTRAITELNPSIVLSLGQAGGRAALTLERVAINVDDARIADNAGQQPIDAPIRAKAPPAYFATLPIKRMVQAMSAKGFAAEVSNSAGTFVCNHLMFGVLDHIARKRLPIRAGFMHVPFLPEQAAMQISAHDSSHNHTAIAPVFAPSMPLEDMIAGVKIAIMIAIKYRDDAKLVGGALD